MSLGAISGAGSGPKGGVEDIIKAYKTGIKDGLKLAQAPDQGGQQSSPQGPSPVSSDMGGGNTLGVA